MESQTKNMFDPKTVYNVPCRNQTWRTWTNKLGDVPTWKPPNIVRGFPSQPRLMTAEGAYPLISQYDPMIISIKPY